MKNRIFSIMDTRKKKAGISVICLVVIGVIMTGVTLAINSDIELIEGNRQLNEQTEESNMVMSYFDEEYEAKFPTLNIEWWTYDGYKAWLDNEKVQLQDIIGERGWNPTKDWYVWTQEVVDETVQMYEQTLQDIKDGIMTSKSVDGDENMVILYNPKDIKIDTATEYTLNPSLDSDRNNNGE